MRRGVTLLELLMVIGILSIIFAVSTMSFSGIVGRNGLDATSAQIRSALVRAQSTARNGISGGVHFESESYTYFTTPAYAVNEASNEFVMLPNGYRFSENTFPEASAKLDHTTGYLIGYTAPAQVLLEDSGNGAVRTISVNAWGIIQVNY